MSSVVRVIMLSFLLGLGLSAQSIAGDYYKHNDHGDRPGKHQGHHKQHHRYHKQHHRDHGHHRRVEHRYIEKHYVEPRYYQVEHHRPRHYHDQHCGHFVERVERRERVIYRSSYPRHVSHDHDGFGLQGLTIHLH